jgi:UDP-2-acetamido-2,6-beta-L-arabino-hexul-4-ose reductase
LASSTQAELENAYGKSKLDAETAVKGLEVDTGCPVHVYRLPGVFGKWCKPNYNSVVATFCYNISHDLPLQIDNPDPFFELKLVYIDDVIEEFVGNTRVKGR